MWNAFSWRILYLKVNNSERVIVEFVGSRQSLCTIICLTNYYSKVISISSWILCQRTGTGVLSYQSYWLDSCHIHEIWRLVHYKASPATHFKYMRTIILLLPISRWKVQNMCMSQSRKPVPSWKSQISMSVVFQTKYRMTCSLVNA